MSIIGNVALAGSLNIYGLNNFNPTVGNSFTIATFEDGLAYTTDLTGIFSHIFWSGFNPGIAFTASYFDHSIVLNTVSAPIPVPSAIWFFGSGLFGLFGISRCRRLAPPH